jgi:hypothetical protein
MTAVLGVETKGLEAERVAGAPSGNAKRSGQAIYVYLCNGEVRMVPDADAIHLGRDLLCVCGNDCHKWESFRRKDVYFCSRIGDLPSPPPC